MKHSSEVEVSEPGTKTLGESEVPAITGADGQSYPGSLTSPEVEVAKTALRVAARYEKRTRLAASLLLFADALTFTVRTGEDITNEQERGLFKALAGSGWELFAPFNPASITERVSATPSTESSQHEAGGRTASSSGGDSE